MSFMSQEWASREWVGWSRECGAVIMLPHAILIIHPIVSANKNSESKCHLPQRTPVGKIMQVAAAPVCSVARLQTTAYISTLPPSSGCHLPLTVTSTGIG